MSSRRWSLATARRQRPVPERMSFSARLRTLALASCLATAVALGVVGCGSNDAEAPEATGPRAATVADLQELADSAGHPIYWLGPQDETQYELTVNDEGHVFVRYLDPDVQIGSEDVEALTVSTYPVADARNVLADSTQGADARTATAPGDGLVVVYPSNPQSAYLAFPDSDHQAEVFAPKPEAALAIARSGRVEPIE